MGYHSKNSWWRARRVCVAWSSRMMRAMLLLLAPWLIIWMFTRSRPSTRKTRSKISLDLSTLQMSERME